MLNLIYILGPIVAIVLLTRFISTTNSKQRLAVILGWLVPGLGHLFLGQKSRGLFLGGIIIGTFLAGMVITDFRNISPFDRHPIWGIAHAFGGLMTGLATLLTKDLMILGDNPYYPVGCLYSGTASLLNILAMIDVYDQGAKSQPDMDRNQTSESPA